MSVRTRGIAKAIYAYAEDHYNDGGWDVIVECYTIDMLEEVVIREGWKRPQEAIKFFEGIADIYNDRQQDAINSAF